MLNIETAIMFFGSDTVIITENVNGDIYVIKSKYIQDILDDWNENCDFVPANDARVFFASWTITVGDQNFKNNTILVKEEDGNIVSCPMHIDKQGDIYFQYDNTGIWLKWL